MPVFDYVCAECGTTYDIYHKVREVTEDILCPSCGSIRHKKLISAPAISVGGKSSSVPASSCSTDFGGGCCGGGSCGK